MHPWINYASDLINALANFFAIGTAAWSGRLWYDASRPARPFVPLNSEDDVKGTVFIQGIDAKASFREAERTKEKLEHTLAEARKSSDLNARAAWWAMITATLLAIGFLANFVERLSN